MMFSIFNILKKDRLVIAMVSKMSLDTNVLKQDILFWSNLSLLQLWVGIEKIRWAYLPDP